MAENIPAVHNVGDTGHTADHALIVQILNDYQAAITSLQSGGGNIFRTVGGNVCVIPVGTTQQFYTLTLPTGNRDSAVDTISVFYGPAKVFSLNGYGELRIFPGAANHVPAIIQGLLSQTADLLQMKDVSGNVITRFGADGSASMSALNYQGPTGTVETWHKFNPLQSGWSVLNPFTGAWVRKLASPPNSIQLSALLSVNQSAVGDGTQIATLPAGYAPSTQLTFPVTADVEKLSSGSAESPRMKLDTSGNLTVYGISNFATVVGIQVAGLPLDPM